MRYEFKDLPLKRNNKKLYFNKVTCPASDSKKNLLMIHGLTYTSHVFDINHKDYSAVRYFAKQGYTVWRIDIGGYGKSEEYEDGFEVDTLNASKDIEAAVEKIVELQDVENIDILGWSWATMTTSMFAARRPELIRRLVWFGPCFGGTLPSVKVTEPFTDITYPYAIRVFQHMPGSEVDIDYETVEPCIAGIWCDQVWKYDGQRLRPNGGNREIMAAGDDWLIDVPSVKDVEVLIIAGTEDMYVDLDRCNQAVEELVEGSELEIMRGGSHTLMWEKDYYVPFRERVMEFYNK